MSGAANTKIQTAEAFVAATQSVTNPTSHQRKPTTFRDQALDRLLALLAMRLLIARQEGSDDHG